MCLSYICFIFKEGNGVAYSRKKRCHLGLSFNCQPAQKINKQIVQKQIGMRSSNDHRQTDIWADRHRQTDN